MLDKSELELKVEQLEIIELETNAHNGWLTSDTNESFKLRNLFNRKHQKVRQIDHSVFKMIRSAYLGLFSVGIDCCDRLNNAFGLKKFMFYLLHHLVMILLIFFTITNLMAMILSKNNTLQLIIEFIRMFTVFYRFFCLKLLKKKIKRFMKTIQNSLELFPNVAIKENYYLKFSVLVCLYATVQGMPNTFTNTI